MSETGKQKLKGWRESAQKFLTDTLTTNMTPKERKQTWESLTEPKPSWETFKIMLGHHKNPDTVLKKWRAWNEKKSS
jgi:hypothetical protein